MSALSDAFAEDVAAAARRGNVPMQCSVCATSCVRPLCDLGRVHVPCFDRDILRTRSGVWKWLTPEDGYAL